MTEYYLRIERLTQNRYSGDPEVAASPNAIDAEKNLHVYLSGVISGQRSVQLRARRVIPTPSTAAATHGEGAGDTATVYKASLPHYTLNGGTPYILRAIDDDQEPCAIASCEITTI